jgi:hypothetical protein
MDVCQLFQGLGHTGGTALFVGPGLLCDKAFTKVAASASAAGIPPSQELATSRALHGIAVYVRHIVSVAG